MRTRVQNLSEKTIVRDRFIFPNNSVVEVEDLSGYQRSVLKACVHLKLVDLEEAVEPTKAVMMPPRHICGCGFVARSMAGLKSHKRKCDAC